MKKVISSHIRQINSSRGNSYLEIIIALAILAGLASIAVPYFGRLKEFQNERLLKKQFEESLHAARICALETGALCVFGFNQLRKSIVLPDGREKKIAEGFHVDVQTAFEFNRGGEFRIIFYPDGRSSGGEIRIKRGHVDISWKVDWATSHILSL